MLFRIGILLVLSSLIIGYLGSGGNVWLILQPFEWLEVLGVGVGTFIMSNTLAVQKMLLHKLKRVFSKQPYSDGNYLSLLVSIFNFLKHSTVSSIDAERHIDNPESSPMFSRIYALYNGSELVRFFCDYFRLVNSGFDKPYELDMIMEKHITEKKAQFERMTDALLKLGDALPALGIVVAVLGVMTAMGAVAADPGVLAARIASAMVGTFIGIFLSYCIVTPIASCLEKFCAQEMIMYEAIRTAIVSHANGNLPSVSVEFARQVLTESVKPTFAQLEKEILR